MAASVASDSPTMRDLAGNKTRYHVRSQRSLIDQSDIATFQFPTLSHDTHSVDKQPMRWYPKVQHSFCVPSRLMPLAFTTSDNVTCTSTSTAHYHSLFADQPPSMAPLNSLAGRSAGLAHQPLTALANGQILKKTVNQRPVASVCKLWLLRLTSEALRGGTESQPKTNPGHSA